jgi:hypothetical protein
VTSRVVTSTVNVASANTIVPSFEIKRLGPVMMPMVVGICASVVRGNPSKLRPGR